LVGQECDRNELSRRLVEMAALVTR